ERKSRKDAHKDKQHRRDCELPSHIPEGMPVQEVDQPHKGGNASPSFGKNIHLRSSIILVPCVVGNTVYFRGFRIVRLGSAARVGTSRLVSSSASSQGGLASSGEMRSMM